MTIETAKHIVDFAFSANTNGRGLDFNFFGGEPFIRFGLIRDITNYIQEKAHDQNKKVQIGITTNGTILTQEIIDFIRENNIDLCFSIDGPPDVHDRNRIFINGKGSSGVIASNLKRALNTLSSVQVNTVYGPDTLAYLPSSVKYLFELGAVVIHLNPNINADWGPEDLTRFSQIYSQIGEYYIRNFRAGKEIAINLIDSKIILFLKGGYADEDICSMGEGELGFAPSGNIYPCERLIGEDVNSLLCLGNIHSGLDIERQKSIISQRGNVNSECRSCNFSRYCMNWCGCTNYFMTGYTNRVSPVLCASERAAIKASGQVLRALTDIECSIFVEHLMRYLH